MIVSFASTRLLLLVGFFFLISYSMKKKKILVVIGYSLALAAYLAGMALCIYDYYIEEMHKDEVPYRVPIRECILVEEVFGIPILILY